MALAYSRSRHESSDYDRARRQQSVLQQMRKQLDPIALLPHIPALLGVAQQNLFMTFSEHGHPISSPRRRRGSTPSGCTAGTSLRTERTQAGSMQGIRDKVSNIFSEPEPDPRSRTTSDEMPAALNP